MGEIMAFALTENGSRVAGAFAATIMREMDSLVGSRSASVCPKAGFEFSDTTGSPTTHPLPGNYRAVLPDLSLEVPGTQIELRNNDGVILVEDGG